MTERLADISARIESIGQLGAVVNAMKGIAAARAHIARTQVEAVDSYAATIAAVMASALAAEAIPTRSPGLFRETPVFWYSAPNRGSPAPSANACWTVSAQRPIPAPCFWSEPGAFPLPPSAALCRLGTRRCQHTHGIPKLADSITRTIYGAVGAGRIDSLDVIFTGQVSGRAVVMRHSLFPIDLSALPKAAFENPLMQLPVGALIESLGADYFHALVCRTALHAFAAENDARLQAMAAAGSQIARELEAFEATLRRVRQEAITAEIIELGTGAAAARDER
nr:F0F1 ATP synthase subunit gamma [Marinicella sp. W31]MDC2879131.1 F0F1 ATP synthase subunit gamma [Marinicella sp. W31]